MNAPVRNTNVQLMNGNHAVAWGVRLLSPDVAPLYPITPQTPILEKLIDFQSQDVLSTRLLTPESEHSAMAGAIAASATGARVFTATSSQGLLLMHELLHYAAGARLPIVMFNVNRTPAAPWGFWPDQIDSLSQRDTGWIQLYTETPQESLDTTIQAFRIAEACEMPVMVNHDAFYVSHAVEPVEIPDQEMVQNFAKKPDRSLWLETGSIRSIGTPIGQAGWNETRREMDVAMQRVVGLTEEAGRVWGEQTGRHYGPLDFYRTDDAEVVFVTMGSMAGTAREAVDTLRRNGVAAGLIRVRLFRPLPISGLRAALAKIPTAIVLDRNYSPGLGGVLHQELKAELYGMENAPRMHGMLAGVGGVNVPPETLEKLVIDYKDAEQSQSPIWVD